MIYIIQVQVLLSIGGYSSIGRTAECGTVGSLFDPGYSPYKLSQDSSIG